MRNIFVGVVGLVVLFFGGLATAAIQGLQRVASGVAAPIYATHAPGDASRLFILERGGQIRILDLNTGSLLATPFLTTTVNTSGEGGMLGMAFHPDYNVPGQPGTGKFYLNVTTGSPFTTRIREFTVSAGNPNVANPGSLREILSYAQPQTNHNGGWIDFSPNDGYLYIASGDGGGSNDEGTGHTAGTGNAQDITSNLLGKMLRIDVNGDDFPADASRNYAIPPTNPFKAGVGDPGDDIGDDEIWSYGLRNPFRAGFDRATGDLWIGDVGQGAREEIDFQPANSTGAENYGWRLREGLIQTPVVGGPPPPGNVDPVYDYNRDNDPFGGTVVTGGYVYRGPDPSLQGKYFFLDSRNTASTLDDNYWMFDPADPFGTVQNIDSMMTPDAGSTQFPVSFGEDAAGNLYITYIATGDVYRIRTAVFSSWNVDSPGAWSAGTNWTGAVAPDGVDTRATFGPVIQGDRLITLDTPITLGAITFNSAPAQYTIGGTNALTFDVSVGAASIAVNAGNHTISAPIVLNDDLRFEIGASSSLSVTGNLTATGRTITKNGVGTVLIGPVHADGLTINAGRLQIIDGSAVSRVNSLSIAAAGRLDVNNNDFIVDNTPLETVRGYLATGYNAGGWDGAGIMSSHGDATSLAVGYAQASDVFTSFPATFRGESVEPTTVLVAFAYYGDANLDRTVDIGDFALLAANFNTEAGWSEGNFNFDSTTDIADFALMAANFNLTLPAVLPRSVPEPAAAAMLLSVVFAWRMRLGRR